MELGHFATVSDGILQICPRPAEVGQIYHGKLIDADRYWCVVLIYGRHRTIRVLF